LEFIKDLIQMSSVTVILPALLACKHRCMHERKLNNASADLVMGKSQILIANAEYW